MNYKTFAQLDHECLAAAGLTDDDIYIEQRQQDINDCLMKVYHLLDGLLDPFYDMSAILTLAADQEIITGNIGGSNTFFSLDPVNKWITRDTGIFALNSIIAVTIEDRTDALLSYQFIGKITVAGATATYEKLTGTEPASAVELETDISGYCHIIKSFSANSADISSLYVKEIKRIYDNATRKNLQSFDEIKDGVKFASLARENRNSKRIAYHQKGESIDFYIGEDATALGVVSMDYRGKVNLYSEATAIDKILLPPEYNTQLKDEITARYLQLKNKPIPQDLAARRENYQKLYDAAAARKATAMEEKGK